MENEEMNKTLNQHYQEWKKDTNEDKSYEWFIENWCFKGW